MPANLNALIRYKQIDLCLRNPYLKATIEILKDRCSRELERHRGIPEISIRTIREDLKVMRGASLGFNAPIVIKNGIYSYSDPNYSIFKTSIHEMDLLIKIQKILVNEREKIKEHDIDKIIQELSIITGVEISEDKESTEAAESHVLELALNEDGIIDEDDLNTEGSDDLPMVLHSDIGKEMIHTTSSFYIHNKYHHSLEQSVEATDKGGVFQWSRLLELL